MLAGLVLGHLHIVGCSGASLLIYQGIEAIRRDQCGCTSSLLESSLRVFFSTRDLSQLKSHLYRQWMKILANRISLKEFIFYRKCRLGKASPTPCSSALGTPMALHEWP